MSIKQDDEGRPIFAPVPRVGSESIFVSHKINDPTTWYMESVRVTDESATNTLGLGIEWNLAHSNVINLSEGNIRDEDNISQDDIDNGAGHGYLITVKVNGVEKVQDLPFGLGQNDYSVDYVNGKITLHTAAIGATVLVSYSYATGSKWTMAPAAGKMLDIEDAEAQFSADTVFSDAVLFEIVGNVEVFAPTLWDGYTPPGPYPAGTKIPLKTIKYKKLGQVLDEAKGSYPVIPALGGSSRGFTEDIYGFPFRYGTIRRLYSSYGMELHVKLENDIAFGGSHSTVTFYCLSQNEEI